MNLTCNFINTERNEAIEKFIQSLIAKTFDKHLDDLSFIVNIQVQNEAQVPWKCTMYLSRNNTGILSAESQAANYLTAFSQTLMRLKRQWDKQDRNIRA